MKVLKRLEESIPDYSTELRYSNPFELVIATILSAQCTDERVNATTPALFARFPTPAALAAADPLEVEELVKSTGFYRNKAKSIMACSATLEADFGGEVPSTMEDLVKLPGVGRKTANLMLGEIFGKPAVVVDTHVKRVAQRLGLTRSSEPEEIEADLQKALPKKSWWPGSSRLLLHGRYVCLAKKPKCAECVIRDLCPFPSS